MNNTIYTLLCVFLFVSCSNKTEVSNIVKVKEFEKVFNLEGEQILKNDNSAFSISVIDSLLLTLASGTDYHYNLYSKNSFKYLGSLGKRGDEPNSWMFPSYNNQFDKDNTDLKIWLSSDIKSEIIQVNLTSTIKSKDNNTIVDKKIDIDTKLFPFTRLLYVNDSIFYGDSGYFDSKRCRLKRYSLKANAIDISYSDLFPKVLNQKLFPSEMLNNLYHSKLRKKPNEVTFASAMEYFNRIDIFDKDLNTKLSIVGDGLTDDNQLDAAELDIEEGSPFQELTIYYRDINLRDSYIYSLYLNQPRKEFGKNSKPVEIRIFDWEGNAKYLLKIPDYILNISVDEKEGWIYGVAPYDEKILRYNIKDIIK